MWPSYFSTCFSNFILYRGGFVKSAQDNSAPNVRFLVVGPGKVCLGHHCGLKNESIGTCPCISRFCCRVLGRGCVWWARSHLWGLRTELLFLPPVSCPSHIFVLWQLPLSSVFLGVPPPPARLLSWCRCSEDKHHVFLVMSPLCFMKGTAAEPETARGGTLTTIGPQGWCSLTFGHSPDSQKFRVPGSLTGDVGREMSPPRRVWSGSFLTWVRPWLAASMGSNESLRPQFLSFSPRNKASVPHPEPILPTVHHNSIAHLSLLIFMIWRQVFFLSCGFIKLNSSQNDKTPW